MTRSLLAALWVGILAISPAASEAQQPAWPTLQQVEQPARTGDAAAQAWLGVLMITGEGGAKKDQKNGVDWIRKSAEGGNPMGQRLWGDILSSGRLVPLDDAASIRWYRQAAEAGDPDAQSEMGVRYTLGRGVQKDDAEGVRWAMKAAAGGDVAAMIYLGSRYEDGRGVEKNPKTSVDMFRQAADHGSAHGMCYLADMYLWGLGIEKDQEAAYRWYVTGLLANPPKRPIRPVNFITIDGDRKKNCERNRNQAKKALTPDARVRAEQAARAWLATVTYQRIP